MAAAVGTFTLTGQDAGLLIARTFAANTGTFTLSGQDVNLTYSGEAIFVPAVVIFVNV
jgi:hypothetical protein